MTRDPFDVAFQKAGEQTMTESAAVSRRKFLFVASAAVTAEVVDRHDLSTGVLAPKSEELLNLSAQEAITRMTRGDLTSEDYASALLA